MPLDNVAEVETPERVRFRYHVAGPVRRALAYLVDLVVRVILLLVLAVLIAILFNARQGTISGFMMVGFFVLEWGYYVYFDAAKGGRSPGKRVFSLAVVKRGGYPVGFVDSVLRNLLRGADFLPLGYVCGLLTMAADTQFRRIGDHVAGTLVVIDRRAGDVAPLGLSPPATAAELAALPGRPRLSSTERESLDLFLRRAELLGPARREELARLAAPALAQRLGVSYDDPVRFLALVHARAEAAQAPARAG